MSISGTALCPWTFQENPLEKARQVAASVGCPTKDTKQMIACLKERPAEQIVETTRQFRPWLFNPFSPFGLVVEKAGQKPFLPDHPYALLAKGKVLDVPWITSVTADEGLYPAGDFAVKESLITHLNRNWNELAPHILDYNYTIAKEAKNLISTEIKKYYMGGRPITRKTFNELVQMIGDRHFVVDAEKAAKLQAAVTKSPVYFYYFNYHAEEQGTLGSLLTLSDNKYGIGHGDDVLFIFNADGTVKPMHKEDEVMKEVLLGMWTSFAKSGYGFYRNYYNYN